MNIGEWIVIAISVLVGAWYLAGVVINRNRMQDRFRWLRSGLVEFGRLGETRWVDPASNVASLAVNEKRQPYQRAELTVMLERRENPPLWVYQHLRGRRDVLVFKAALRGKPAAALHLVRADYNLLSASQRGERPPLELRAGGHIFSLYTPHAPGELLVQRLQTFLKDYPEVVLRISLQAEQPNLVLHALLTPLRGMEFKEFYLALGRTVRDKGSSA